MATRSGAVGGTRARGPARKAARPPARKAARAKAAAATRDGTIPLSHPATLQTITVAALVFLGLIMILSASSVTSFAQSGSSFMFFKKQALWVVVGVVAFLAFARLDYRRLRGSGFLLLIASAALLVVVLIPGAGVEVGGSSRWLRLGPASFQPSEFAKLALIMFLADVYSRKKESTLSVASHTLLPLVPVLCVLGILVMLQPDMGTTLILGAVGFGIVFVAGAPMRHLIPLAGIGTLATTALALSEPYRRARLLAFQNPFADPFNTGYQTVQSLIAIGSGGWFGVGLGASRQKWSYIPNAHTDYIFAILGEEMGLIGTMAVLGMFAFLIYLGIRVARKAPDRFGMLLASGITIWMGFQALVNIGAMTASLPVTGVPLPLVSFGGSSLVASLVAMGILRNIAVQARR